MGLSGPFISLFCSPQQSDNSLGKVPSTQNARCSPQIAVPVPVLILCTADFQPQKRTPYLAMLVQLRPFFEEVPGTVNDLGTAFGFESAQAHGKCSCRCATRLLCSLPGYVLVAVDDTYQPLFVNTS